MGNHTCSIDGCDRSSGTKTICPTHYGRIRKHGVPDPYTDLKCQICGGPITMGPGRLRVTCEAADCKRAIQARRVRESRARKRADPQWKARQAETIRAWREANPAEWKRIARASTLRQAYGMSVDEYDALLASQGGRCAICEAPVADAAERRLHVDHDHACCPGKKSCGECVRGLLCKACNQGIGHFGDDPERLRKAIEYLSR